MIEIYYNHKLLQLDTHPPEFKDWDKWNIINNYTGSSEVAVFLELLREAPYLQNLLFLSGFSNFTLPVEMQISLLKLKIIEINM